MRCDILFGFQSPEIHVFTCLRTRIDSSAPRQSLLCAAQPGSAQRSKSQTSVDWCEVLRKVNMTPTWGRVWIWIGIILIHGHHPKIQKPQPGLLNKNLGLVFRIPPLEVSHKTKLIVLGSFLTNLITNLACLGDTFVGYNCVFELQSPGICSCYIVCNNNKMVPSPLEDHTNGNHKQLRSKKKLYAAL